MNFAEYAQDISKRFATGDAREHTHRGSLQNLIESLLPDILATNEPARISCGAPDYVLTRKKIPVGYIEAKDIGVDLNKIEKDEQLKRYLESLDNLILTDYLEFRFFRNKQKVATVKIAEVSGKSIKAIPENFSELETLFKNFAAFAGQAIKSPARLAEMMAHKARLMRDIFKNVLDSADDSTLKDQFEAFKKVLMHDLTHDQFADIYAQTITYGLFTARLHDETLDTFSREEARGLIPASNPFLRKLFDYISGVDLDERVKWIVDDLCDVYRAADVKTIIGQFGAQTGRKDPILHFYETFLGEYDPKLRKARGVWYTPEAVVHFIVRAIDDVLKDHFQLPDGIADTSKIDIDVESDRVNKKTAKREMDKKSVHKVQMLDVATGTGTFLAEAIKQIYANFKGQEGLWSRYVDQDLLPRLHGFELLMASYAMCHMKLDMLLGETGYQPIDAKKPPRLSVYLTNSLEEYHPEAHTLFASWLAQEANEASRIKKDSPIMVAFGNPPYSGISSNMNSWIAKQKIDDYKYINGVHFDERKHWLNDDYVQFIRLGEHYIEKNGEGVLAYITNHSYLDNPTFRGMRHHLMQTFDDIYIVDLHGNGLKKEKTPTGERDMNVFDIQAGVAIMVAVKKKTGKAKKPANIHHLDLWGEREDKYNWLYENNLKTAGFKKLNPQEPFYFFIPKNMDDMAEYQNGFAIDQLFQANVTGIVTARDSLTIDFTYNELKNKIEAFITPNKSDNEIRSEFFGNKKEGKYLAGDSRGWNLSKARQKIKNNTHDEIIKTVSYRPFDDRKIYYTPDMVDWGRDKIMSHMIKGDNVGLITARSNKSQRIDHFFITKFLSEAKTGESTTQSCLFPLYFYEDFGNGYEEKRPNLDQKIFAAIQKTIPHLTPENLFDYIYGVLHSPIYRARYAEFLKSDFPRIPYPTAVNSFDALSTLGAELRTLHLLESPIVNKPITTYPIDGDHMVVKPRFENGNVYINDKQYFGAVPPVVWEFYIGGYQPAQKWLKDRKGRNLTIDDIKHYGRMIVALNETARIMREIEKIDFLP
jgi:predicted helicase